MTRTQLVLGGLLLLQLTLIAAFRSPLAEASRGTDSRPLLPALEDFNVDRIEILGNSPGAKATLVKGDGGWIVDEADGFPADPSKVEKILDDLEALKVRRPVVSSGRYHETFKVRDDDFERRIRLWGAEGSDPEVDLLLGSTANYRMTHARIAGEDPVYEVRLASFEVRPDGNSWIRQELVDVPAERVAGLILDNENGTTEVELRDGVWVDPSRPMESTESGEESGGLDQQKVTSLIRVVTGLRISEPAGRKDAHPERFESPVATLTLRLDDGTERTLTVGNAVTEQESKRYVGVSGFEFAGTVWGTSVQRLIDEGPEGLLAL